MKYQMRIILFFVGIFLFAFEGTWANYASAHLNEGSEIFVLRILFIYLIFVTMFADRMLGLVFAGIFGLMVDISSVGFVGVYTMIYPALIFGLTILLKLIHENIFIALGVSVVGVALLEIVMYKFYLATGLVNTMGVDVFVMDRLLPTLVLNTIVTLIVAAPFYFLCKKVRQEIRG